MNKVTKLAISGALIVSLIGQFLTVSYAQGERGRGQGNGLSALVSPSPKVIGRKAVLLDAVVAGISSSTLSVFKNGQTFSVDASAAKLRARFWGNLSLSDIQVNDHLNIWGTWTDQNKTSIKAKLIRDLSDQRRAATFFGKITQKGTNTFVLATEKRGNQTVNYVSGPIVNRKQQTISFSTLSVGDRIRVRGLWDRTNSNVAVDAAKRKNSQIKDFSIPVVSPKPSATP